MGADLVLYAERHADGRAFTTTASWDGRTLVVVNASTAADGTDRRWGRAYGGEEAAAVLGLLGADGADGGGDPAAALHAMAAAGELPADQPLTGWLAEHGVHGEPLHDLA